MVFWVDEGPCVIRCSDIADDESQSRTRFFRCGELDSRYDLDAVNFVDFWSTLSRPVLQSAVLTAGHTGSDLRSLAVEETLVHVQVMMLSP